MRWNDPTGDRRHVQRVCSTGSVTIQLCAEEIRARIEDLAVGGVRLILDPASKLLPIGGVRARMDLRLDGSSAGWLRTTGHVLRVRRALRTIAVQFDDVPSDFEDLIQDELLGALERDRSTAVLIVDAVDHRRRLLAEAFRVAGCHVTEARTPLEAIFYLDDSRLHAALVAVADTEPTHTADELRRFVSDEYPRLRVIGVGPVSRRSDFQAPRQPWLELEPGPRDTAAEASGRPAPTAPLRTLRAPRHTHNDLEADASSPMPGMIGDAFPPLRLSVDDVPDLPAQIGRLLANVIAAGA